MSALSESINEIKTHILVAESEVNSLITGRKASASRVRKSLQEVKKLSHLLRKAVIEHVKLLPVKTRVSTIEKPTPESMGEQIIQKPTPESISKPIQKPTPESISKPIQKRASTKRDPSL
jgi:predicted sulfurtransferase